MTATDTYTFSAQEQARLASYRAAVRAGFYSEFPGGRPRRTSVRLLRRLLRPVPAGGAGDSGAGIAGGGAGGGGGGVEYPYPFTPAELRRLEACRAAVAGGYYSDELGPEPAT